MEHWNLTYWHFVKQPSLVYDGSCYKDTIVGAVSLCLPNWHINIELPTEKITSDYTNVVYEVFYRENIDANFVRVGGVENIHSFLDNNKLPKLSNYKHTNEPIEKDDLNKILSVILCEAEFKSSVLATLLPNMGRITSY